MKYNLIVLFMCVMSFTSTFAQNESNIVCTTSILCEPIYICNGTCNNCTKCDGLYCISCILLLSTPNISLNCGCDSPNICPTNPSPTNPPDQNDYISISIVFSSFIFIFICIVCVLLCARRPIIIPVQEKFHDHIGEPHYDTFHQIS